jgi:hypothetical protein
LPGIGEACREIDVQKTIHIDAPVEKVFAFWTVALRCRLSAAISGHSPVQPAALGGREWESNPPRIV